MVPRVNCQAKAPCLRADDRGTRGCRALLEYVVVVLLSMSGFLMKTFYPMSNRLWQCVASFSLLWGVFVELRCTWAYPGNVLFFWFSLLAVSSRMFCVYRISHNRLCKRASSPSCIRPCTSLIVALFVKRDESLF